ncbi:hypothetical protein PALB_19850 [Pseudoalteromonas luteoviolacea B = ATCC 29581]|nr:hypothetical protein PALB_19850 [Pseudoalteromonas luteoviolacea B = ATCC 29581]
MILRSLCVFVSSFIFSVSAHQGHTHEHEQTVSSAAPLAINNAWIREALPGAPATAAYFDLTNHSEQVATLVKATVEGFGRVEMHEHLHENGMMKMRQVATIELAPNSEVKFQPGGFHLMLFEAKTMVKDGNSLKLTLYFADGDRVYTMAKVQSILSEETHNSHQHHH